MPDERIQQLINELRESESIEVKNWLNGLADGQDKAKLAKEIIALANWGGGHIFIGFTDDDGDGHQPIRPGPDDEAGFAPNSISSIIHRYCTPAIQCMVEKYSQAEGKIAHPVISVPAADRVPIWAARQDPEGRKLKQNTIYVRRPGGYSEPCCTQDDWERLLDRLVRSRQDQLISAVRNVLNPEQEFMSVTKTQRFNDWLEASRIARDKVLSDLPHGDPLRLERGYSELGFVITPFDAQDIVKLSEDLALRAPSHSGWPPFVCVRRDGMAPRPMGDVIQAWLVDEKKPDRNLFHADFWRLSVHGEGYLVRPMQEDRPGYGANLSPRPHQPGFDCELPMYRMTEVLKLIEWLGLTYSSPDARFEMRINYCKMNGRRLTHHRLHYAFERGQKVHQDQISSQVSGCVGSIALNAEDMIYSLMRPIFAQFEFAELPRPVVRDIVQDVVQYRV